MKTYSDYTLNNLNKHSLIKIIKDLYEIRDKAIEYCEFGIKEWITDDGFVEETLKGVLDILQGNKEK